MRSISRLSVPLILAVLHAGPSVAGERANTWEFSAGLFGTSSEESNGRNGASLDVDSAVGFAFGIGYNFTEKFAVLFNGGYVEPDYEATYNTDEVWLFMDGPFTPFVTGGFGGTYADSNVSGGPPVTGCWWDPWWGYICQDFFDTYDDTLFSYGIGAGLRYDFENSLFVRGSINRTWADGNGDGADPEFDSWRLEVGWKLGN